MDTVFLIILVVIGVVLFLGTVIVVRVIIDGVSSCLTGRRLRRERERGELRRSRHGRLYRDNRR